MMVIVQGVFHSIRFKKTDKGGFHQLRVTQDNDLGVNTEVFNIFDEDLVNELSSFEKNDFISLYANVYEKNGFFNRYLNSVLNIEVDLTTGEKIS